MSRENNAFELMSKCRLCLTMAGEHDIFKTCKESCLDNMISSTFSFTIQHDVNFPTKICLQCKNQVVSSYKFKLMVENVNKKLHCLVTEKYKLEKLMNCIKQYEIANYTKECACSTQSQNISQVLKTSHPKDIELEYSEDTNQSSNDFDEDEDKPLVFVKSLPDLNPNKNTIDIHQKKGNKTKLKSPISNEIKSSSGVKELEDNIKLKCSACPQEFTDRSSLRRHNKVQHLGVVYYCKVCKKNYRSKFSHKCYEVDKGKINKCSICDEMFKTIHDLKQHIKSHAQKSEYACDVCEKKFSEKHLCLSHKRRVHDKEKPYECTYCPKKFFSSHSLKDHITTHTKERRYDCKVCGMLFTTTTILKEHELRHSGNKEFTCSVCEKGFYRKKDKARHELIHSNSYDHECTHCGLKFRRKDHLKTHERSVHNSNINK